MHEEDIKACRLYNAYWELALAAYPALFFFCENCAVFCQLSTIKVKNSSAWRKLYKSTSVQCAHFHRFECFREWRNLLNRPQQQLSTIYRSSLSMSVTHTFVPIREIGFIFALIFARADRWWFDDHAEKRASEVSLYPALPHISIIIISCCCWSAPLSDWSRIEAHHLGCITAWPGTCVKKLHNSIDSPHANLYPNVYDRASGRTKRGVEIHYL